MPEATFCITSYRKDGSTSYTYPESESLARDAFAKRREAAFTNPNITRITLRYLDSEGGSETLDEWIPA